ncbi:hypothetical protein [Legionella bozemanae]|nr:hypothetical protein [Legionella bozemanae]
MNKQDSPVSPSSWLVGELSQYGADGQRLVPLEISPTIATPTPQARPLL